jgi:2,3-bisphosphoglycerate-dependent phosphoglycerate mutase
MSVQIGLRDAFTDTDNERGIATGWLPGRLSEAGLGLGERRSNDGVDVVFASDLQRAVETVNTAFPNPTVPILLDWRLRECNYGDLKGAPLEVLHRKDHLYAPYPSGESWRDAIARVESFLRNIAALWGGCRVLVVGHSATHWGLDYAIHRQTLEELVEAPFTWQEGWEFVLDTGVPDAHR